MTDDYLEALYEAHELIIVEREDAKQHMRGEDRDGHINGLNEARNRVEQLMSEYAATDGAGGCDTPHPLPCGLDEDCPIAVEKTHPRANGGF